MDDDGIISSMDMSLSKLREIVKDREDWRAAVHGFRKSWTRLRLNSNNSTLPTKSPLCSVSQSCPTPSDPMDCSLSGPSVHGIFQARVLEWVAIAFSEK